MIFAFVMLSNLASEAPIKGMLMTAWDVVSAIGINLWTVSPGLPLGRIN